MAKITLLPRGLHSRAIFLEKMQIPVNYMSDFTIMGFIVDRFEDALTLLHTAGYHIDIHKTGADIIIENSNDLPGIQALFSQNEIHCDYSDIADTIYQS